MNNKKERHYTICRTCRHSKSWHSSTGCYANVGKCKCKQYIELVKTERYNG